MIKFFNIDAVHPILKRVIKHNLPTTEANALHKELLDLGYEDIIFNPTLIIMEAGDRINLSSEFIDHITDELEFSEFKEDRDVFHVKRTFNYIFRNGIPPVIKGTLIKIRAEGASKEEMFVIWDDVEGKWKQTNVNILETIGYKFAI